jgi:hypothetical protein
VNGIGSPVRRGDEGGTKNKLRNMKQTPTKLKQLNRLKQMGFTEEEHNLRHLLEKYNDSIEGVLGELLS